eukprot:Rhum_TRINITY_DN14511_c5_g1::Rhum_TRINITY_DN14511_c5_g1_i1::g.93746::m.93746
MTQKLRRQIKYTREIAFPILFTPPPVFCLSQFPLVRLHCRQHHRLIPRVQQLQLRHAPEAAQLPRRLRAAECQEVRRERKLRLPPHASLTPPAPAQPLAHPLQRHAHLLLLGVRLRHTAGRLHTARPQLRSAREVTGHRLPLHALVQPVPAVERPVRPRLHAVGLLPYARARRPFLPAHPPQRRPQHVGRHLRVAPRCTDGLGLQRKADVVLHVGGGRVRRGRSTPARSSVGLRSRQRKVFAAEGCEVRVGVGAGIAAASFAAAVGVAAVQLRDGLPLQVCLEAPPQLLVHLLPLHVLVRVLPRPRQVAASRVHQEEGLRQHKEAVPEVVQLVEEGHLVPPASDEALIVPRQPCPRRHHVRLEGLHVLYLV